MPARGANDVDVVVVGAGVCGLACAAALSEHCEVLLLESNTAIGQGSSSRNSEVLHAGLYYEPGSLKARLCRRGRELLLELQRRGKLPLDLCGKIIVARSQTELPQLDELAARARQNTVGNVQRLSGAQVRERLPLVECVAALFSPGSGILDSHALMEYYRNRLLANGGTLLLQHRVCAAEKQDGAWLVSGKTPKENFACTTTAVVNAAGLYSDKLAEMAGLDIQGRELCLGWNRGEYFATQRWSRNEFPHLVYPLPSRQDGHLGIHLTLDLAGAVKFGPSVMPWPAAENYEQGLELRASFVEDLGNWLPELRESDLQPAGCGLRARLTRPGASVPRDFYIAEESAAGLPGWINLIGIESPGLTASPAIAELVLQLWKQVS